jgi:hypothetical protein
MPTAVPTTAGPTEAPTSNSKTYIIIGSAVGGVFLLGLAFVAYWRCSKKQQVDMDDRYTPLVGDAAYAGAK